MHRLGGRLLNVAHRRDCPSVSTVSVFLTSGFYCFAQEPARQPIEVTYLQLLAARSRNELSAANG